MILWPAKPALTWDRRHDILSMAFEANLPIMACAINDWESDLKWLKEMYYRGRMQFEWPDTTV